MSAGGPAAFHAVQLKLDDICSDQTEKPADRAGEANGRVVPVHVFGKNDAGDNALHHVRKQGVRGAALVIDDGERIIHAVDVAAFELFDGKAFASGKTFSRTSRRSRAVKGGFPCRPFVLFGKIRLTFRNGTNQQHEATGSAHHLDTPMPETLRGELLLGVLGNVTQGARHKTGRYLLRSNLQNQISFHRSVPL